jgi:hypothetical protein
MTKCTVSLCRSHRAHIFHIQACENFAALARILISFCFCVRPIRHCVEPGCIFPKLIEPSRLSLDIMIPFPSHFQYSSRSYHSISVPRGKSTSTDEITGKGSFLTQLVTWNWPCLYQIIKAVECDRRIVRSSPLFL